MKQLLIISLLLMLAIPFKAISQDSVDYTYQPINWLTWNEGLAARALSPKKILIFINDDTNPQSLKMETKTMTDTVVNIYLNNYYYCVRLDAKEKDTIHYQNRKFTFVPESEGGNNFHALAQSLTYQRGKFPALVVFNESFERLQVLNGYLPPDQTSMMLARFAHNEHLKQDQAITFGQKFQCQDPNHPHNRLRNLYQSEEKRAKIKTE